MIFSNRIAINVYRLVFVIPLIVTSDDLCVSVRPGKGCSHYKKAKYLNLFNQLADT
jgi:hypothetical protein